MMRGEERREKIIRILENSGEPVSGLALAGQLDVSRQVIVQDIALLRARDIDIYSTCRGYVINRQRECSRILKLHHLEQDVEQELEAIVDLGGRVKDVFVFHKVYGVIKADMNIRSRRDVSEYMKEISSGKSGLLMNVTSGYHYHTVVAESEAVLDLVQGKMQELGFLAKLKEYEPVDFWSR